MKHNPSARLALTVRASSPGTIFWRQCSFMQFIRVLTVGILAFFTSCQTFTGAQLKDVMLPESQIDSVKNRVICLGSGLTWGATSYDPYFQSYPAFMDMYFYFNDLPYSVINAGIDGDGPEGIFLRIDAYLDPKSTKLIILDSGGLSYFHHTLHGSKMDLNPERLYLEKTIEKIKLSGIPVVLLRHNVRETDVEARQFVKMFEEVSLEYNIPMIDFFPDFSSLRLSGELLNPDGIHLSEKAYLEIARNILRQLNPAFNPTSEELDIPNSAIRLMPWFEKKLDEQKEES